MRRGALLWLGLAIAFSPVLINLVEGLRAYPADRYTLLVPLGLGLHALRARRAREAVESAPAPAPRVGLGTALIAAGLIVELLGVASASWGIARLGLPLAALGVALRLGAPSPLFAVTVFGAIPLPSFVQYAASPEIETAIGGALAAVFSAFGVVLESRGALLYAEGVRFELLATDSGLLTAASLFLGGWFSGLRARLALPRLLRRATGTAALALILHPLLLSIAAALLAAGAADAARTFLTHGATVGVAVWMVVASLAAEAEEPPTRGAEAASG